MTKHTLKITTRDKRTKKKIKTEEETFFSIYNLERRKFEIDDGNHEKNKNSHPCDIEVNTRILKRG